MFQGFKIHSQVIVRPQQQLVVRQQQPGVQQQQLVIRPHQQAVLRPQQNGTQQIFIRYTTLNPNPSFTCNILCRPSVQQPLVVRPANSLSNQQQQQQGQIRLTAQQLASLTSQQIVIRPASQNGSQQQILISRPATSVNSVAASGQMQYTKVVGSPVGTSVQLSRPQIPSSSVGQVSGAQVQISSVQSQGKSVVTYLRQVKPEQAGNVNLQNIRLSGQNVRFSAASTAAGPVALSPAPAFAPQSGVIRLGARAITPSSQLNLTQTSYSTRQAAPPNATVVSSSFQLSLPSAAGLAVQRQLRPNIVRSGAKMIAPRIVQSSGVVRSDVQGLPSNNIVYKQGGSGGVSLLTQGRGEARMQDGASKEGLHLITADGKFINTEGLHLLSPNGTVLKAESLLQNITSTSKPSPEKPGLPAMDVNTQQLINNLQQPLPYQATSLSLSLPPPQVVSAPSPLPPSQLLSPVTSSLSPLLSPPSSVLLSPSSSVLLSPPRILDSSPLIKTSSPVVPIKSSPPTVLQNPPSTSIQSLLPTQPLLPSQIRGLSPVARNLNFSPRAPTSTPKARAKSKRETLRAKVAKLESSLNTAPLLALIDKRGQNAAQEDTGRDTELERDFLMGVEVEARGEFLDGQALEVKENFYKHNKVNRYLKLNLTDDDSDESGEEPFEEGHLMNLLKKHVKRKKRKMDTGLDHDPGGRVDFRKFSGRGPGKGKGSRTVENGGSSEERENVRRRRLWLSIMKKEITKGGKARNYNMKEKMAGAKRLATACMRVQRQKAMASQRLMKETVWRAKRLTREMQVYWRKYEREEKQQKKAKEKVVAEQRKMDIELLEAKRQQRKLNFLITQTELYAHFMAGKLGMASETDTENKILAKLDSDIKDERLLEIDDYDADSVKKKAKDTATIAAQKQESIRTGFDQKVKMENGNLQMSEAAETAGDRPQPDIFQGTLKTYQLKGMNWLCSLYDQGINGILADEMGLGKTVQALAFLSYVAEKYGVWGPFLVVTPASTLHNWQQEIAKFVPDFKCVPYWGSPQERKVLRGFWSTSQLHTKQASFHIVVTSYQIVITDYKYFSRQSWQYMVLDEAQAIKSASSQRWKMLLDFNCRGRLLLSGTPIQNTMAELWSLLHFVMPALFDSHDEFKEWFSKDIEGHAEGSKGKVDEKQMSRLHLILKPFMLRRIKKEVEHELTDKVEVLLYCPLTIRQRLLYAGLKQNLKMEELLAGLGLGNGVSSLGVSSLMNLVMQFRKVCNHPELFERREPRSPLLLSLPSFTLPNLPFLDPPNKHGEDARWNILRSDRVHASLKKTRKREFLEVSDSPFSFLRFCNLSPEEPSDQSFSLFKSLLYLARQAKKYKLCQYSWATEEEPLSRVDLILKPRFLPAGLTFTSRCSTFLCHADQTISHCPETIHHRQIRSRQLQDADAEGIVHLVAEFPHQKREVEVRKCQPTVCPNFLMYLSQKATALPSIPHCSSRQLEYRCEDHLRMIVRPGFSGESLLTHGSPALAQAPSSHYTPEDQGGLTSSRPALGWSGIVIPEKASLISDAGKLFVLDGLLARLKEGGHRVLIYSQMTRMIDLLEEYMSHRQHSYMRLDGSSKIHERRDMVADFQNRQDIFVFLLSTRAGGLGINLTAADTVIFYDSDWNPTVDQQAMDRAHR